ncbi:hypothetical protein HOLleu_25213 [Holothuria leucospilota]|uniref:Uncharacterized protein n=1 Tax=Holothuria leucospilota TaxID=206669 RepID=A0A9Q1BSJ2_HOLLE|nr:hypothetical protein HOLleu_25213 [Holothuria leucospilota]
MASSILKRLSGRDTSSHPFWGTNRRDLTKSCCLDDIAGRKSSRTGPPMTDP